jgi:mannonate dehydratase
MQLTFRWFGDEDPIPLEQIRQIPGVRGIVSALYDVSVGEAWPREKLSRLAESIHRAGMRFAVVESIPVHEDIKLGRPTRDSLLDNYAESVRNMGEVGVPVLCYNFMPVFDWMRTNLATPLADGSTAQSYHDDMLSRYYLSLGTS